MKITALIENTSSRKDLLFEHALSLYIETKEHKILFDMGASDAFLKNAKALGVSLDAVDFAVLSHGHYDHGGGLMSFLSVNRTAPVYINRYAFETHFNKQGEDIGISPLLLDQKDRIRLVEDQFSINDRCELLSCNECIPTVPIDPFGLSFLPASKTLSPNSSFMASSPSKTEPAFTTHCAEQAFAPLRQRLSDEQSQSLAYMPDSNQENPWKNAIAETFRHEQYLVIREGERRIVISGCSHKGVINLMSWLAPDVFVGGFHFFKIPLAASGKKRLAKAAAVLNSYPCEYITGHCTGVEQYEFLRTQMPKLRYLSTGETVII